MAGPNHYELLGVSPSATPEEIKDAFRDTMYRFHPDHNPGKEDWAVERTMDLVRAYHTLSDAMRKAVYDIEVQHPPKRELKVEPKGFSLFVKKEEKEKAKAAEDLFRGGVTLFEQPEKRTQAASEFLKASKLAPDRWEILFNLALTVALLGRFPESLEILGRALKVSPEQADVKKLAARVSVLAFGSKKA